MANDLENYVHNTALGKEGLVQRQGVSGVANVDLTTGQEVKFSPTITAIAALQADIAAMMALPGFTNKTVDVQTLTNTTMNSTQDASGVAVKNNGLAQGLVNNEPIMPGDAFNFSSIAGLDPIAIDATGTVLLVIQTIP